jgi:hypothetical protein
MKGFWTIDAVTRRSSSPLSARRLLPDGRRPAGSPSATRGLQSRSADLARATRPKRSTLIKAALLLMLATAVTAASTIRPTTDPVVGAYGRLSPRQQRIVKAFVRAERAPATSGRAVAPTTLTPDQIAGMKAGGYGWQQIFDRMKSAGLVQEESLRQLIGKYYHPPTRPAPAQ